MSPKYYPKTVMLRKNIIGIVLFGVLIIVALILWNLSHSSHKAVVDKGDSLLQIKRLASSNDTSWYKEQTFKAIVLPNEKTPNKTQTKPPILRAHSGYTVSTEDHEELLKAMSAPIASNQLVAEQDVRRGDLSSTNTPDVATQTGQNEKTAFLASNAHSESEYLESNLKNPLSMFEVQAGSIIPCALMREGNSDLPGQITAYVRENVYDSISGNYLLIPQGTKAVGRYDSTIAYGQERLLVVWHHLKFPNGQTMALQGMEGIDLKGSAGFSDKVNNHYLKIFGGVVLTSMLAAGAQLSQPQNTNNNPFMAPTVNQTIAQSLGTNIANTGTMITNKNMNIQPTLIIRQGYRFNIDVKKDMVFPGAYDDA